MTTKMHKMLCSNCGCETVRVFIEEMRVVTECTKCSSTSELIVVVEPPKIEFRFGSSSEGKLSVEEDP